MTIARRLVVYGAGGHGRVVAEAASDMGAEVLGFLDDNVPLGTQIGPSRVLGGGGWLDGRLDVTVVPGIGDNFARQRLVEALQARGVGLAIVVHPRAVVSRSATLGPGSVVLALAVINAGARIGRAAIVNTASVVEHDVELGDFAHVSPNATLGGSARLGDRTHLGLGACVLPGITVGARSVVGAGAVVTREVPDGEVVAGVPAQRIRMQTA